MKLILMLVSKLIPNRVSARPRQCKYKSQPLFKIHRRYLDIPDYKATEKEDPKGAYKALSEYFKEEEPLHTLEDRLEYINAQLDYYRMLLQMSKSGKVCLPAAKLCVMIIELPNTVQNKQELWTRAMMSRVQAYWNLYNTDEALILLRELETQSPDDLKIQINICMTYSLGTQYTEALEVSASALRKIEKLRRSKNTDLDLDRYEEELLNNTGVIYQKLGQHSKALELFHMLNVKERKVSTLLNMASCYLELHEYERTRELLSEVLKMEPNNQHALYSCGMMHLQDRKYGKAVTMFANILKGNPNHLPARNRYQYARALYVNWQEEQANSK